MPKDELKTFKQTVLKCPNEEINYKDALFKIHTQDDIKLIRYALMRTLVKQCLYEADKTYNKIFETIEFKGLSQYKYYAKYLLKYKFFW